MFYCCVCCSSHVIWLLWQHVYTAVPKQQSFLFVSQFWLSADTGQYFHNILKVLTDHVLTKICNKAYTKTSTQKTVFCMAIILYTLTHYKFFIALFLLQDIIK
jgi:hypothetical protein